MNVTMKPVVKTRRKDGSRAVYIRVTFGRASRHIPTTLTAMPSDLTRSGHIKNATILERAGEVIQKMRGTLSGLSPFTLEGWTVDDVVAHIRDTLRGEDFRLDFFEFYDNYIQSKSPSTRDTYRTAINAFGRYLGRRSIDVNAITRALLLGFVEFLNAEPRIHVNRKTGKRKPQSGKKIENSAAASYLLKLGMVFRAAREKYNDEDRGIILIPRSPFDGVRVKAPRPTQGQRSIGQETMQRVILAETGSARERLALDLFVVSFCLMGANFADLYDAAPPVGGVWEYHRRKTEKRRADGALMRVTVPECAAPFVARLRASGEQCGGYWLPALRIGNGKESATAMLNAVLRAWARREGLPEFTFYAARHTWATLARGACRIEKATVDECLGHVGDFAVTDIYAERSWDVINAANAKVLDLFEWPTTG